MRALKFRAWVNPTEIFTWGHEKPNKGIMYTGFSFDDIQSGRDESNVFCAERTWEEPKWGKAKIMQFTGLYDKYKKPIFEGDICHLGTLDKHRVVFRHYAFCLDNIRNGLTNDGHYYLGNCVQEKLEVIGNVYENPELIKGEK